MTSIVVTGATGYIGRYVVGGAKARGWRVVAASRQRPSGADVAWIPYRLEDNLRSDDFEQGATLLHLAADTRGGSSVNEDLELAAAGRLLDVARARLMRFVFVSSQAARIDAPTAYGRAKWQVEQQVLRAGGWVVRPGLVYGGQAAGFYAQLVELVRGTIVLPALVPAPRVQPIHVADLAEGLLRIAERDDLPSAVYNLAAPDAVSFTTFLRAIAAVRLRRRRFFVPAPLIMLEPALRIANAVLGGSYDIGRVRSLVDLPPLASAGHLAALRLRLRWMASGMHPSSSDRRRRLLCEGRGLLSYVLGTLPPPALVKRYVRAIEHVRNSEPAAIPRIALRWPYCMALLDSRAMLSSAGAGELDWRLDAATVLAEASPVGARRFLAIGASSSPVTCMVQLAGVALAEAFWRFLRFLASPLLRRALAHRHGDR